MTTGMPSTSSCIGRVLPVLCASACAEAPISGASIDALSLRQEPVVVIGESSEDPAYVFDRIAGARFVGRGRVAVADAGSSEIRLFDESGSHLASFGRRGAGPGEFTDMAILERYRGDSIIVFDRGLRRITILDADATGVRTVEIEPSPAAASVRYVVPLRSGDFVGRATIPGSAIAEPYALWRDTIQLVLYDQRGAALDELGRLPGDERYSEYQEGGSQTVSNHPLGLQPWVAAVGDSLLYAEGSATTAAVMDRRGRVVGQIGIEETPSRLTGDVVESTRAEFLGDDPDPGWRMTVDRLFEALEWPEYFPSVRRVLVGRDEVVWLERFPAASDARPHWIRLPMESGTAAEVVLPPRTRLMDSDGDRLLTVRTDDLDVERIEVLQIEEAARDGSREGFRPR